jgi:hypothetical protein
MNPASEFHNRLQRFLLGPLLRARPHYPDAATQKVLMFTYWQLARSGGPLPGLADVGFRVFSQTDEDGILLYIFSLVGATTRTGIEICAGDGTECNSANLIINHGWHGLLVDGKRRLVQRGRRFYRRHHATQIFPPVFEHAWVTRDNVDTIIASAGFSGDIDLLSIDMDGVDYWIWEAISVVSPRVVVVEYQDILGPDRTWVIPYSDDFNAHTGPTTAGMPNFCGASLPALVKLAKRKGYRLVGCNRYGFNAFFVQDSLAKNELPAVSVESCFKHPKVLAGMRDRFPTVQGLPWVEV